MPRKRWPHLRCTGLAGCLAVVYVVCLPVPMIGGKMDRETFEKWFAVGVTSSGHRYIVARQEVIGAAADALPLLRVESVGGPDWRRSLVAEIWVTWITAPLICSQVTEGMQGHFGDPTDAKPITGSWSPSARGQGIAGLGRHATPRILEILLKTGEYSNDQEQEALFVALGLLKDPRATLPLVTFLEGRYSGGVKKNAALALSWIGDSRAVGPLSKQLLDDSADGLVRSACALALGRIRDRGALEVLVQTLEKEDNPVEVRQQAASALGALGDSRASPVLSARLAKEDNPQTLKLILAALENVGDSASLAAVAAVAQQHPDETVRERAQEAHGAIAARLSGRP